jgi:hypothetical protein
MALAVLWSLTALAALSASPHTIECADDVATVTVHDSGGHAMGAVRTSADPLHCLLCHWIRAFSADDVRAPRLVVVHDSSFSLIPSCVEATRAAARLNLPPRAPPV